MNETLKIIELHLKHCNDMLLQKIEIGKYTYTKDVLEQIKESIILELK